MHPYFSDLSAALAKEKNVDEAQFLAQTKETSVAQRREKGLTWYPLAIRQTEAALGDYLQVLFERTTHHELSHSFKTGVPVAFFSQHNPTEDRIQGVVTFVGGNQIRVHFRVDELPDWSRDGKLGLDVLFDAYTYDTMQEAMQEAWKSSSPLIPILTGSKKASFDKNIADYSNSNLNDSQVKAINKMLSANELAILHGPPGTGKTTTLVAAIQALVKKQEKPLLACAASNTAVDLLTEKLVKAGVKVMRVGHPERVSAEVQSVTMDSLVANHPMAKEIKNLRKQAREYKNLAHKYKRNFGFAEREQRRLLFDEAKKITKEIEKIEAYILDDIRTKVQVITGTLIGINQFSVRKMQFSTVVIDEAGQALEPAMWVPCLRAEKVILAGDHRQLPPTIKSDEVALAKTMLEKLVESQAESVVMLDIQYRMHENIMSFPSLYFYENRLQAHPSVKEKKLFSSDTPAVFIDTAGTGFEEKQVGTSAANPEEAAFAWRFLQNYLNEQEAKSKNKPTVGVISPYKEQVNIFTQLLDNEGGKLSNCANVRINTVDSFQGQERDVILISLVRSNTENSIGFLHDLRRMNVAMTRAKKKLILVGDSATFGHHPFYQALIQFFENQGTYHSAWEFMG